MKVDPIYIDSLMAEAIREAKTSHKAGEVPVGALIIKDGEIIARAHNEVEVQNDATAHAELLAIRRASAKLGNWRLNDTILCVTLEPCVMCMGAIKLARIPVLVFGAWDEQMGAAGSLFDLSSIDDKLRVISGVREDECKRVMQSFFRSKRDGMGHNV